MERAYESMMIIRDDVTSEEKLEIHQKIVKKIESLSGKVVNAIVWAEERTFTFAIRGSGAGRKRYSKGSYWLVNYILDTTKLPELKETVRLEERILRAAYYLPNKSFKVN